MIAAKVEARPKMGKRDEENPPEFWGDAPARYWMAANDGREPLEGPQHGRWRYWMADAVLCIGAALIVAFALLALYGTARLFGLSHAVGLGLMILADGFAAWWFAIEFYFSEGDEE